MFIRFLAEEMPHGFTQMPDLCKCQRLQILVERGRGHVAKLVLDFMRGHEIPITATHCNALIGAIEDLLACEYKLRFVCSVFCVCFIVCVFYANLRTYDYPTLAYSDLLLILPLYVFLYIGNMCKMIIIDVFYCMFYSSAAGCGVDLSCCC